MSIAPKPIPKTKDAGDRLRLKPFQVSSASIVAGWVSGADELRLLAPMTAAPLTAQKVAAWQRPQTRSFLLFVGDREDPVGYAELNAIRDDPYHYWLGHIVLCPALRGLGIGGRFVRALVSTALDEQGARRVSLIVCPDNAPAIRCYERAGFDLVSEEIHRFPKPPRRIRMLRYELRL